MKNGEWLRDSQGKARIYKSVAMALRSLANHNYDVMQIFTIDDVIAKAEFEKLSTSLEALRKIDTACKKCGGGGKVFRKSCAEDEGNYYSCDECMGEHSEEYKRVCEDVETWPEWKKQTYNHNFATSAHAKKIPTVKR